MNGNHSDPIEVAVRAVAPPVDTVEARAAATLPVSAIEPVARLRLFTVTEQTPLVAVAALLSHAQINVVVVCDAAGRAVGTITETILVHRLGLGHADVFTTCACDVMARDFPVCTAEDLLSEVLATMHERGLTHVLLLDAERKPKGVVHARDGLRAMLAVDHEEVELLRAYVMGLGYR